MPVILPLQYETNWLRSSLHLSQILQFLAPFHSEKMYAYPMSNLANLGVVNDASMIIPIGEKLQVEYTPMLTVRKYHYHKTKPVSNIPWFKSSGQES